MDQLLKMMGEWTNALNNIYPLPNDIQERLTIHFYNSESELYEGIVRYTPKVLVRARRNSEAFENKSLHGTITYLNDLFHIHVLRDDGSYENNVYMYIHELIHICNQIVFYDKNGESILFEAVDNRFLHLWDEYTARYYSSMVYISMLKWDADDCKSSFIKVLETLQSQVECDYSTYDGSQYLGFLAALIDSDMLGEYEVQEFLANGNAAVQFSKLREQVVIPE